MELMHTRFFVTTLSVLLLGACMPLSQPTAERTEMPTSTSSTSATSTEIGSNEAMPESIESLEVRPIDAPIVTSVTDDGTVVIGDPAALRLHVITDPRCTYCQAFIRDDLPGIEKAYVAQGHVAIALTYAPVLDDDDRAAREHLCAALLGHHDTFALQYAARNGTPTTPAHWKAAGIDAADATTCLRDPGTDALMDAATRRAASTERVPSFLIGDTAWIGQETLPRLRQILDAALQR